jgi:hypothetical protein
MSRLRHEAEERKRGGKVEEEERKRGGKVRAKGGDIGDDEKKVKEEVYEGAGSETEKEAERRKRGGAVKKGKMPVMIHGHAPRHHENRPGRKSGGSVGADSHPMTAASRLEPVEGMSRGYKEDREDD